MSFRLSYWHPSIYFFQVRMAHVCSICVQRQETKDPVIWCSVCEEALCSACNDHHRLSKLSRDHTTIPYENYKKLPPFILNVQLYCSAHKERYQYICRNHDVPICRDCLVESHKKCQDTPNLDGILGNVKSSTAFENVDSDLVELRKKLLDIIENREENVDKLQEKKNEMKRAVEKRCEKLINHINELKKDMVSRIDTVISEREQDIRNLVGILKTKEKSIKDITDQKDLIKQYASDYQTFIGVKDMEKFAIETTKYIQELTDKKRLHQLTAELQNNGDVEGTILSITSLGHVNTLSCPSGLLIKDQNRYQAQFNVQKTTPINLKFKEKVKPKFGHYYGVSTLSNGLIVFPNDEKDIVYIHNADGSFRSEISFKEQNRSVYDVTTIDENRMAISSPGNKTITIIDVPKGEIEYSFSTNHVITGMVYEDGDIIYCAENAGLMKINIETNKVEEVVLDTNVEFHSQVAANSQRLCYTCPSKHTLTILDSNYKVLFNFKNESLLKTPQGVAIDDKMNVFVGGWSSGNVVVVYYDGKTCLQLLNKNDGFFMPSDVYFDRATNELLVVDYFGGLFRYLIEK